MRLKDPFSLKAADMTKRTNKPRKPRDEESSDEVSGKLLGSTVHQAVRALTSDFAESCISQWIVNDKVALKSKIHCFVLFFSIRVALPACEQGSGTELREEIYTLQRVVYVL